MKFSHFNNFLLEKKNIKNIFHFVIITSVWKCWLLSQLLNYERAITPMTFLLSHLMSKRHTINNQKQWFNSFDYHQNLLNYKQSDKFCDFKDTTFINNKLIWHLMRKQLTKHIQFINRLRYKFKSSHWLVMVCKLNEDTPYLLKMFK